MSAINKDTIFHFLKNPIGLIGLVTVVFESIAVVAFSTGIDKLHTGAERLPIIWFIVGFPVIVLITITLLVIFCHTHLYGPADFKNEDNFTAISSNKLEQIRNNEAKLYVKEENKQVTPELIASTKALFARAELYGLQIASRYFGIKLNRNVQLENSKLGIAHFDGMAFKDGVLCVSEVKLLPGKSWRGILEQSLSEMHQNITKLKDCEYKVEAVLVIVFKTPATPDFKDKIYQEFYSHPYNFRLEIAPQCLQELQGIQIN